MTRRTSFHGAVLLVAALFACSGDVATSPASQASVPSASVLDPVVGIPDPGDDPAVVGLEMRGALICAGSLIAPDVVITARHCVLLQSSSAPPCLSTAPEALADPASLGVRLGDSSATAELRAYGRSILVPAASELCEGDIAVLLLDRTIDDIEPLVVRATGVAQGDHVRTVGFARRGTAQATKIVRDHVPVVQTDAAEFRLDEEACEEGCGGPTMDESTGQIVGILSGPAASPGPSAGENAAPGDVGTRADAFSALVRHALTEGAPIPIGGRRAKTKKGPIDAGANCKSALDCSAGVCVSDASREYCSRTCSNSDRCPARFRCQKSNGPDGPLTACVEE